MKNIYAVLALFVSLTILSGCETMGDSWDKTWDSTKGYYKEYINPEPVIDYEKRDWSSNEEKMAMLFTPVDKPIDDLSVYLNREDRFPSDEWFEALFARFPWISGVAVVALDGTVVYQRPETSLKPLNFEPALALGQEFSDRRLRAYTDMSPLGPEMYLATGMFKGNDLAAFISVHFDYRSVVSFCPAPQDLIVFTADNVLWSGGRDDVAEALRNRPWTEILADDIAGSIEEGGEEFSWLTRYIGDTQVIYATRALESEPDEGFSFFGLF